MKLLKYKLCNSTLDLLIYVFIISISGISCIQTKTYVIKPTELKCEYAENPLGIENPSPELSWMLQSETRNQKQTGYRILVSGNEQNLQKNIGDLWDSHKVLSDESVHVRYEGKKLSSRSISWWKVCV